MIRECADGIEQEPAFVRLLAAVQPDGTDEDATGADDKPAKGAGAGAGADADTAIAVPDVEAAGPGAGASAGTADNSTAV